MARALGWLYLAAIACGGAQRPALPRAGGGSDDGGGALARQSMQLAFGADEPPTADVRAARSHTTSYGGDVYGGDPSDGSMDGGERYRHHSYAESTVRQGNCYTPDRHAQHDEA